MSNTTLTDDSTESEKTNQIDSVFMGAGMLLGVVLGLAVGLTIDMPALGASSGIMLGMSSGIMFGYLKTNE